ncbi:MAG: protein involved in polysaccharide export [Verrucomicrobia bacterium]|nr:MAG: protein involved in polysaccharide export [Verrucomicrobiota bacterium]
MDFTPRALLLCVASAALLALLPGCTTDGITGANPEVPAAATAALVRPGDSLTVALQGVPDPSTNQVQISDGDTISLPYIGPISTASATTGELARRIRETYIAKKFYTTLDVSVSVTERYVYVGGEVTRPGRIIWTPDLTVAKAVQAAGGFTLYAKESKVNLVREQKAYEINITRAQKNPAQDVRLMPGDSVQVPRSPF